MAGRHGGSIVFYMNRVGTDERNSRKASPHESHAVVVEPSPVDIDPSDLLLDVRPVTLHAPDELGHPRAADRSQRLPPGSKRFAADLFTASEGPRESRAHRSNPGGLPTPPDVTLRATRRPRSGRSLHPSNGACPAKEKIACRRRHLNREGLSAVHGTRLND